MSTISLTPADIATWTTRRLMVPWDRLYETAKALTGEPTWTHQLPRVFREVGPQLAKAFPAMAKQFEADDARVTEDNANDIIGEWNAKFGIEHELAVPLVGHVSIDPMTEAIDMMGPERVMGVSV